MKIKASSKPKIGASPLVEIYFTRLTLSLAISSVGCATSLKQSQAQWPSRTTSPHIANDYWAWKNAFARRAAERHDRVDELAQQLGNAHRLDLAELALKRARALPPEVELEELDVEDGPVFILKVGLKPGK